MADTPTRIVNDSMIGLSMPPAARWSDRVSTVLGLNPGPFTGPGTNTYLVGIGPQRILIDVGQGVREYVPLLERSLRDVAGADGIEAIVLTHGHPDHIGGLDAVLSRFGPLPVSKMRGDGDGELARELRGGDEIATFGATLRAIWTPGHARDHLCFYLEEERALFTGDMVLGAGTTVIPPDGDLGDYLASLRRLLDVDARVIYPAHGPAIHDPRKKIQEYLAHRALRDRQILEELSCGPKTVKELVTAIYVDVPESLHSAAAMSVQAHLRKLLQEHRVTPWEGGWRAC